MGGALGSDCGHTGRNESLNWRHRSYIRRACVRNVSNVAFRQTRLHARLQQRLDHFQGFSAVHTTNGAGGCQAAWVAIPAETMEARAARRRPWSDKPSARSHPDWQTGGRQTSRHRRATAAGARSRLPHCGGRAGAAIRPATKAGTVANPRAGPRSQARVWRRGTRASFVTTVSLLPCHCGVPGYCRAGGLEGGWSFGRG